MKILFGVGLILMIVFHVFRSCQYERRIDTLEFAKDREHREKMELREELAKQCEPYKKELEELREQLYQHVEQCTCQYELRQEALRQGVK